jgi:hypothetical protein
MRSSTSHLILAGASAIGPEARSLGLAAWWVDDRGRLAMTPGARLRSSWIDESRVA